MQPGVSTLADLCSVHPCLKNICLCIATYFLHQTDNLGAGLMNENRILILTPDVAMELWYLVVISLGAGA